MLLAPFYKCGKQRPRKLQDNSRSVPPAIPWDEPLCLLPLKGWMQVRAQCPKQSKACGEVQSGISLVPPGKELGTEYKTRAHRNACT